MQRTQNGAVYAEPCPTVSLKHTAYCTTYRGFFLDINDTALPLKKQIHSQNLMTINCSMINNIVIPNAH